MISQAIGPAMWLASALFTAWSGGHADGPTAAKAEAKPSEAEVFLSTVKLSAPHAMDGLFVGRDGKLYGAGGYADDEIVSIDGSGKVEVVAKGVPGPIHLAQDKAGNLFASNYGAGTVTRIAKDGEVSVFARGFDGPAGLAMNEAGDLFVANWGAKGWGGTRIHKVAPDGTTSVFVEGQGILTPIGLAFGPEGELYVTNAGDGKLHRVSKEGQVELVTTVPRAPQKWSLGHLVFAEGKLYTPGNWRHVLYEIELDGTIREFAGTGTPGQLDGPCQEATLQVPNGLAYDPVAGALWIAEGGGGPNRHLRKLELNL